MYFVITACISVTEMSFEKRNSSFPNYSKLSCIFASDSVSYKSLGIRRVCLVIYFWCDTLDRHARNGGKGTEVNYLYKNSQIKCFYFFTHIAHYLAYYRLVLRDMTHNLKTKSLNAKCLRQQGLYGGDVDGRPLERNESYNYMWIVICLASYKNKNKIQK